MYTITKSVLILSLTAILTGCGGGGGTTSSTATTTASSTAVATAIQKGQVTDSITGTGLENVKVSIGSAITTTDASGYYSFSDLTASEEATVNFKKEGYLLGSTQIQLKSLSEDNTPSPNYLEFNMHAYSDDWKNGRQWSYESQDGASGGAVEIPADATVDTNGKLYSGTVSARWVLKDVNTEEGRNAFPGAFKGINSNGVTVPFVSYALTIVELKDTDGNVLDVSENITLILDSVTGTSTDTIPLWYYDYDQGLWIEEGYAERQTDGSYRAEISHAGTWSLSQPLSEEVGIYRGHIINEDGSPMSNVRIHALGTNWISSDLSTDENGLFELEVIPGSSFTLAAYDYKNMFGATYNNAIAAITSGDVVEE